MSKVNPSRGRGFGPLSIEQLEVGLRTIDQRETDLSAFWDENIEAFRQTVLLAICETSDALLSPRIPLNWRVQLETQLEALLQYFEFADRYIARRFVIPRAAPERRSYFPRIH